MTGFISVAHITRVSVTLSLSFTGGGRMWAFHGVDLRIEGPVKDGKIYKRWSLPLSQAACSSLCDLWCLFPLPKGGRAKLLSTSRIFESHPREKGEDPPPHPPTSPATKRRGCSLV